MDREKIKRRQNLKVIISETIMVLVVIVTVAILALIVSGYWINSDFEVERQGMLQVSSVPTGANVEIDDETSWLQRTNTSKVLASGEHTVKLTKEKYDSWTKKINISEGLLYRLHYPRLFLQNRKVEKTIDTSGYTYATVSPDYNTMLLINETTNWSIVDLDNEKLEPKVLSIAAYFSGVSIAPEASTGTFSGKVLSSTWSNDNNHVLLHVDNGNSSEWVLVDVNNPKNSVNLTKEFGADFGLVRIFDDSASNLLAVRNGNLHKINISSKQISSIIVDGVTDFDFYDNEIVFVALTKDQTNSYYLGIIKSNNTKVDKLSDLNSPAKVAISKFYDNKYITVSDSKTISLYQKDDFSKIKEFELNFAPSSVKVGHDGEFIVLYDGINISSLDMEVMDMREWTIDGESFGWVDKNMIFSVASGKLIVYDFDGLNRRELADNVSSHFPTSITNDKWLYYFSDNTLIREWLIEN